MRKTQKVVLSIIVFIIIIVIIGAVLLVSHKGINVDYDNNHVVKCGSDYFYCSVEDDDLSVYKINEQAQKSSKIYTVNDGITGELAAEGEFLYLLNSNTIYKLNNEGNVIDIYTSDNTGFENICIINNVIYLSSWSGIYTLENFSKLNYPPIINSFEIKEIGIKVTIYGNEDIYLMNITDMSDFSSYQSISSLDGKYQCSSNKFYIANDCIYLMYNNDYVIYNLNDSNYQIGEIGRLSDENYSKVLSDISSDCNHVILGCANFKTSYFLMFSNTKYIGGKQYDFYDLEVNDKTFDNDTLPIAVYNNNMIYYDFKEDNFIYADGNIINSNIKLSKFNSDYLFSTTDDKLFIFKIEDDDFNEIYKIINLK